jgi:putative endonuclease
MEKGYIYITTNKNFTVLYVGATKNLKSRMGHHKKGTGAVLLKSIMQQF